MQNVREFVADEAARLDIFLAKCLQKSRSQVAQLIKNGGVKCNGVLCEKNSFKLKMGDKLEVIELTPNFAAQNLTPNFTQNLTNQNSKPNFSTQNLAENCENQNSTQNFKSQNDFLNQNLTQNSASKNDFTSQNFAPNFVSQNSNLNFAPQISAPNFTPQNFVPKHPINFDIAVLYEDSEVLVLNKPAGVVVHSAPSVREATLVDWLLAKGYALSNLGGQLRAGLVHRLDKGTSGALIIAKNNAAHESLCKQLQNRALGRFYLALTDLPLKEDIICIEKPLIRCPKNRLKKLAVSGFARGARTAKTAFANVLCGRDLGLNFGENLGKNLGENVNFGENLSEISSKKLNSLINLGENSNVNLGANLNENLNVNLGKNVNFETNLSENSDSKKRTACVVDCHDFATQNLAMTSSSVNLSKNSRPNLNENLGENLEANLKENLKTNSNENSHKKLNSLINLNENSRPNLKTNSTKNSNAKLNPNSKPNLNKILNINLIAAKLFTGRTHQIRAHLESLNRHILGDKLYGYKGKDYERVMLHAYFLYFTHPKTGEEMLVKAPLFEDFKQILNHFDEGELYEKLSATYIKRLFSAVS